MKCPVCGDDIPSNSLFCPNCGTRVTQPSSSGAPTLALPESGAAGPPLSEPYSQAPEPQAYQPPAAPQWIAPAAPLAPAGLPNSTTAIVSLVFGILGWFALPVIGPIVAVVAGHMARAEIRRSNGQVGGSGMATAGLVLGYLQIALLALVICAIVAIGVLTLLGTRTAP
jgi:hypothetical protein